MVAAKRRAQVLISQVVSSAGQNYEEEAAGLTKDDIFAIRKNHFAGNQTVSYSNTKPLLIVRGEGSRLFDDEGNSYLDTRNNVCHVGHAHPTVAYAVSQQISVLNTNTRYLHPNIALLAKRLIKTFGEGSGLEVCFFVNSGSEANDLAMRLAFAKSTSRQVICVAHGYHGHTEQTIDISPYKFLHKGGKGRPPNTHVAPCPDTYRGPHRGSDAAERYVEGVHKAIKDAGGKVAAFIVESGMSVGGVILPPQGYLTSAYKAVRAAGGVCIADEVQTGFGRFGKYFWGFQQQEGAIPDIVTMGKPFGNGMPLAAVVTTKEVANAFNNGVEYFNTFGGNPVCCAAGLAVFDILREERLQEHALEVGEYFVSRFKDLAGRQPLIGDVRGSGLFIGVEFVRDRSTLEPATAETSQVVSRMYMEHNILMSIDGANDNVIVIKPPLCFSKVDVDTVISAMEKIMGNLHPVDKSVGHTPT
eukprot:gnl/MRDRNA2_/MRDRNA2_117784_c0_seq1.p1 gnl/MRDRNA2_/MRDRNA2_117784_c0~~gnl/MRDRNA2_/MRDRNA2_117784_c0_seq1.p1  ORF type:complete len:491 (-),score=78.15 gnl/MRDRNA2_/MRDRNA2_117784_c0_seq1:38-1453(-)